MMLGKSLEFPFDRSDRVEHTAFGKGRVQVSLGASGDDEKILVRFDSGEERIILSSFLKNLSRKDKAKAPSVRRTITAAMRLSRSEGSDADGESKEGSTEAEGESEATPELQSDEEREKAEAESNESAAPE